MQHSCGGAMQGARLIIMHVFNMLQWGDRHLSDNHFFFHLSTKEKYFEVEKKNFV